MLLLYILALPLIPILIINLFDKNLKIVKIIPIISSVITLFIILFYINSHNLTDVKSHLEIVNLYPIYPELGINMSFSINKISVSY